MCLNVICRDLTAVNETVSQWSAGGAVSDIEKDIVLEKLRAIYRNIKSTGTAKDDICPEEAPQAAADDSDDMAFETDVLSDAVETEVLLDAVKKRRALLSLYDQQTGESQETHAESSAPTAENERHNFVPAEKMNTGEQTLAEAYAQHRKPHDISSEISCGHVETLSGAIGINDKFLMIRNMFDGDTSAYEDAMRKFEMFHDLDDAMVYIYENYNWDPDSEGVTMLVDLLTRKLS